MGSYVHLEVAEILRETDKALLVRLEEGDELWIPLSQIADAGDYRVGDTDYCISVTKWWADKEGIGE